jgi:hypothetical protein
MIAGILAPARAGEPRTKRCRIAPVRALLRSLGNLLRAPVAGRLDRLQSLAEAQLMLAAQAEVRRVRAAGEVGSLREVEFRVFSQWGEDGILQYLLGRVPAERAVFVEFGVQDYRESNTRFLLMQDDWRGLVLDADAENVRAIGDSELYWRHHLTALCRFVTRENINDLIREAGIEGDIGLLSIDIDGNDYWVWRAIDAVRPRIVVCEYNSLFGARRALSIPYAADFSRSRAHHSNLYFGASLPALCRLAAEKGYVFVGSNSAGSNAFFVLREFAGGLRAQTAAQAYVESRARESRDASGALSFASGAERLALIRHLPVVDLESGATLPLSEAVA